MRLFVVHFEEQQGADEARADGRRQIGHGDAGHSVGRCRQRVRSGGQGTGRWIQGLPRQGIRR